MLTTTCSPNPNPHLPVAEVARLWTATALLFVFVCFAHATPAFTADVVGPLLGTVESTTAHILYRPAAEPSSLELSVILPAGEVVKTVTARGTADNDFVAKFAIAGLQPNTQYRYQIDSLDNGETLIQADESHTFTTANAKRTGHSVTVGFVSCVDIEPNGMWKDMQQLGVDALCLMGDTPYIDKTELEFVRGRHRSLLQLPDLAALARHTSVVGTWDDHDFGLNNGNGRNVMQGKPHTRQAFVEYRAHNQYGTGREGVYHKMDLGMIEVFLLDPRYFSQTEASPVDPAQPTCLGAEQWAWLLENLRASKAPFKVLAMGAIWEDKKNSETDDMFTYWYERDALLDVVKREQISGVVLLGGDIHVARHLIHPRRVGYDLHDFVISPGHTRVITQLDVYHPSLEWSLVEGWQFLTLTADGTSDSPTLTARYRQPDGVINRTVTIPLKQLTAPDDPGQDGDADLRAAWSFDEGFTNASTLGARIDAIPYNGATIDAKAGIRGGALKLERAEQQFAVVPRSFLDDNSAGHSMSMWFKPTSLPAHDSGERQFLLESTAEGRPASAAAYHLSLGLRAADEADKVNLQLYTQTLQPAAEPEAAPRGISQGGFDALIPRERLADRWNHVAVVFDAESLVLYLNGERLAVHRLPVPGPAAEFGGLVIGGHRDGTGRSFDGWIDEVKIWQGVLDEQRIGEVFRANGP
ncbi:alkaline phosphatase D family protein [Roseimaritima ulvae]|uniref:Alkaline phosphatase D n=1 Tax=Roseimaritima ulvae TaxID=980254 RepID=A0A5B9QJT5_9BACT|nr:alkaline phosphatase D family protein [Roseimaritima ulvae]QEG39194.1 Alkaline phosphatase D precursor [Roseimaritima ulvae]